jgi:hypothetical protein
MDFPLVPIGVYRGNVVVPTAESLLSGKVMCVDADGEAKLKLGIGGINDGSAITSYLESKGQPIFFGRSFTTYLEPSGSTTFITLDSRTVTTLHFIYTGGGWDCYGA